MDEQEPAPAGESTSSGPADGVDHAEDRTEVRAHNRRLLRRYIVDVLGEGKMDVVRDIFHPDVEMDTRDGRTITGQEPAKEYLAAVRDRFADLETNVEVVIADQTEALAKFEVTAVHEDDYFGVDATNREVTFRVFSKAVITDGKMIEQGDLVNPLRMQPRPKRHGRFAVLEQIHDGVLVLDRDGRIVEINPVAAEMLDVADSDPLNEPVQKLIDDEVDLPEVGSSTEVDLGAGQRTVEISTSSLTDLRDNRIGRILVFRDVTAAVRRRQQLEMLSRRNDQLDQFVSVTAHDLRNPLATAVGRVELARETGDLAHLDTVVEAHDRMETIIDDLLSSRGSGIAVEEAESISLAGLTETAWETAQTDRVILRNDVPDEVTIVGDPDLLQHILENLFRNAADHNDPPLTVSVGTLAATDDGTGFFVEDDGRGIPPEARQNIFDRGYSTDEDGTGLGLSIVREFVQTHGWEIAVTESPDGGARFEITGVEFAE